MKMMILIQSRKLNVKLLEHKRSLIIDETVFLTPPPVTPEHQTAYKCKQCEFVSHSLIALVSHVKEHKPNKRKRKNDFLDDSPRKKSTPSSPCHSLKNKQATFTCDPCGTTYARKDGLKRHYNKVH